MKVHLRDSNEPLKEGASLTANCGELVANVRFPFMWDETAMGSPLSGAEFRQVRVCRKCIATWGQPRYLYGIVNPQEVSRQSLET